MFTKPLTRQTLTTHVPSSEEMSAIRRLLVAATISPRFRAGLLKDPAPTIRSGFGGEQFRISESTMSLLATIRVSSLPEFIQQLDHNLSNQLLMSEMV